MGLRPTQGMKIADNLRLCPSPIAAAKVSGTLPFVIPSEAEGSAVQRTFRGNVFRQNVPGFPVTRPSPASTCAAFR
jgi:hypothetical protein